MKKALKKNSFLIVALPLMFVTVSCSDDDSSSNNNNNNNGDSHEIEYRLTIEDPVLTSLSYTNAEGNIVAADESLEELTTWSKTIEADAPFSARMEMEFETMAGSPRTYSMQIFVDGELMHYNNDMGSGNVYAELQYNIQ